MTLNIYIDESGTHDGSEVITVAAMMAWPHDWDVWSKEWNRALKPFNVYHAVDVHNCDGEFKGFENDKDGRNEFVKKMLSTLGNLKFIGISRGIDLRAFREYLSDRPKLLDVFPRPYLACLQWVLMGVLKHVESFKGCEDEEIAFIHEKNDYQQEVLETFYFVDKYYNKQKRRISLVFGDKTLAPLQAADILAYESRHALLNTKAETRKPWLAIDPKEGKIELGLFGPNNMDTLIKTLEWVKQVKDANAPNVVEQLIAAHR